MKAQDVEKMYKLFAKMSKVCIKAETCNDCPLEFYCKNEQTDIPRIITETKEMLNFLKKTLRNPLTNSKRCDIIVSANEERK